MRPRQFVPHSLRHPKPEIVVHAGEGEPWLSDIVKAQSAPERSAEPDRVTPSPPQERWPSLLACALMGVGVALLILWGILQMPLPV